MDALTAAKLWLTVRPIRRWKERRALKRAEKRIDAEMAGGEHLYEEDEPMLKGKITYASVAALAFGCVSMLIGVDIAPTEVDAIVTAIATVGAIYGRWRATRAQG